MNKGLYEQEQDLEHEDLLEMVRQQKRSWLFDGIVDILSIVFLCFLVVLLLICIDFTADFFKLQ